MPVRQQMGYSIHCDWPGCRYSTSDIGDYAFWGDLSYAEEEWTEGDNIIVRAAAGTSYYCNEHAQWDDEGDEMVPLPLGYEGELILMERNIQAHIGMLARVAGQRLKTPTPTEVAERTIRPSLVKAQAGLYHTPVGASRQGEK